MTKEIATSGVTSPFRRRLNKSGNFDFIFSILDLVSKMARKSEPDLVR